MNTILHGVGAFLASREFAVNFVANLGGAMVGVLLAFWIERVRARRDARHFYGRILQTSRSELAYLKPMCQSGRDALSAGKSAGTQESLGVPATRALVISPLAHDQAPYSLIMALTILCSFLGATEVVFRESRGIKPQDVAARDRLNMMLGEGLDKAIQLITIALEQMDAQLDLLGLKRHMTPQRRRSVGGCAKFFMVAIVHDQLALTTESGVEINSKEVTTAHVSRSVTFPGSD